MKIQVNGMDLTLTVGADPEVFVTANGKLVSAHGLVRGNKEHPYPVTDGAIQVDGMALEYNIDPAKSKAEFIKFNKSVLAQLVSALPSGHIISIIPTAEFGAKYIASQPPTARELGCSSDTNAYTGNNNPKPNVNVPFRTAAGHVHIGWTSNEDINNPDYINLCCEFTKVLDLYLGVPSVLMDPDTKRRSLYGAAGSFRAKTYGLEYRVLSNFWLKSDASIGWVYDQVVAAITAFLGGYSIENEQALLIVDAINNSKDNGLEVPNA